MSMRGPAPTELRHLASSTSIFLATLRDVLEVVEGAHLDAYGDLRDTLVDALRADEPGTPARLAQVVAVLLGEATP